MTKKYSHSDRITLHSAIKHSFSEIENALNVEIIGVERAAKAYGSNANSFFIKAISDNGIQTTYFLKFGRENSIDNELEGNTFIQGIINTPKIVLFSKKKFFGYEWILYEYIHGNLMSEAFLMVEDRKKLNDFFKIEKQKESHLKKLHSKDTIMMTYTDYIKSKSNKLFRERFLGKRYKEFYKTGSNNISSLFDRNLIINGNSLNLTVNQILDNIRKKYKIGGSKKAKAVMGHGDAHHGNIIINNGIWFIDNEYAGYMTPFMELAKPYYNDFLGTLFFHHSEMLNKYFNITGYEDNSKEIRLKIDIPEHINKYIEVTRIKLSERKTIINKKTEDFLSLNEYLILCHILTKNPNNYSQTTQKLFLVFIVLLALFDPYNPESIYSYF